MNNAYIYNVYRLFQKPSTILVKKTEECDSLMKRIDLHFIAKHAQYKH